MIVKGKMIWQLLPLAPSRDNIKWPQRSAAGLCTGSSPTAPPSQHQGAIRAHSASHSSLTYFLIAPTILRADGFSRSHHDLIRLSQTHGSYRAKITRFIFHQLLNCVSANPTVDRNGQVSLPRLLTLIILVVTMLLRLYQSCLGADI